MNELALAPFHYNQDQQTRDSMLSFNWGEKDATYRKFSNLDISTLKQLVALKFADPDEQQNDAPTIAEFVEFMEKYPNMKAHGYVTGHPRSDYRLSIEGVEGELVGYENMRDFIRMFRIADEFEINESGYARCWYD